MKKLLTFEDSEKFYRELRITLQAGDEVEIITSFKRYSDLPTKLKEIFELEKHRSGRWINVITGAFVAGSIAPAGLNMKVLIVAGAAGVGAVFGLVAGGPIGAAVGAGLGLAVGAVAAAMSDKDHEVDVEIDNSGRLRIKVRPIAKS